MINDKQIERTEYFRSITSSPISFGFKPREDGSIIAVRATVRTRDVKVDGNECAAYSTALFSIVQKTDDGFVQDDYAVDFSSAFLDERIGGKAPVGVCYSVGDIKSEQSGDEYTISAIIDSEVNFFNTIGVSVVERGDNLVTKNEEISVAVPAFRRTAVGDFEGDREYPFEIEAMLSHEERVRVTRVTAQPDVAVIDGEILSEFLFYTKRGEFIRESLTVPFKYEAECEGGGVETRYFVFGEVLSANYKIENAEEGRLSTVSGNYTLRFTVAAFDIECVSVAVDGFSKTNAIDCERDEIVYSSDLRLCELKTKCFGEAASDKGEDYVVGVIGGSIDAFDYRKENGKLKPSGLVRAELLVRSKDGTVRQAKAELPFSCEFDCDGDPADVEIIPHSFAVKELDEKCVLECELFFTVAYFTTSKIFALTDIRLGDELESDSSAVKIIFVEKGECAWSVCKKARVSEDELYRQNPELRFPTERDSGIVIYKKINME